MPRLLVLAGASFFWTNIMSNMRMPFGKHKGDYLKNVPPDYLRWVLSTCNIGDDLRKEICDTLGVPATPTRTDDASRVANLTDQLETAVSTLESAKDQLRAAEIEKDRILTTLVNMKDRVEELQKAWKPAFRKLAMTVHPDRGGDPDAMRALNDIEGIFQAEKPIILEAGPKQRNGRRRKATSGTFHCVWLYNHKAWQTRFGKSAEESRK